MRSRQLLHVALFAAASWLYATAPGVAAEKLKFGLLRVPQIVFVAIEKGYFAEENLDIEPIFFRNGAEIVPSLSRGQIDIGATSPGAALYNAMAQGVNAKIVADYIVAAPGQPGGDPNGIAVRKDLIDGGKVKQPADLRGMTMAITARGQLTDMFAATFLKSAGLTEKDVRIVLLPYPDMLAALQGKAIEAAVAIDPQITVAEEQGIAVRFQKLSDLTPGLNVGVVMYGDRLSSAQRDLGMRFMRAYQKGNAYMWRRLPQVDGRAEIAGIFQKYLPIENPALYQKMGLGVGAQSLNVNVDGPYGLRWQLAHYTAQGLIPTPPDLNTGVDKSFAEASTGK